MNAVMLKKCLIVDDDKEMLEELIEALDHKNYQCDHLNDGEAAQKALKSNNYDLAILDIKLPKKNGFQVLKFIKTHHIKTKVIILTGTPLLSNLEKAIANVYNEKNDNEKILSFADAVFNKPCDVLKLLKTVDTLLNEESLPLKF